MSLNILFSDFKVNKESDFIIYYLGDLKIDRMTEMMINSRILHFKPISTKDPWCGHENTVTLGPNHDVESLVVDMRTL